MRMIPLKRNRAGYRRVRYPSIRASDREIALRENLTTTQSQLTTEQEKTRLLMLPNPDRKPNWVQHLFGIQPS